MTRLAGPRLPVLPVLPVLLVLLVAPCAAQEDAVTLEVIYPQRSITAAGGSSVKLSCDAVYDVERCDALHAAWYRTGPDAQLTDPGRYFTTVNETDGRGRRRQVVTEIRDLKAEDGGLFQCKAECEAGDKAMGHYITITVEG